MPVGFEVVLTFVITTDLEIGGGQKRVSWPVMELFGSGCKREKFPDRIWTFQIAQPDNNDRRRQFHSLDILVLLYQDKRTEGSWNKCIEVLLLVQLCWSRTLSGCVKAK